MGNTWVTVRLTFLIAFVKITVTNHPHEPDVSQFPAKLADSFNPAVAGLLCQIGFSLSPLTVAEV